MPRFNPYDTPYGAVGALRNVQDTIRNMTANYIRREADTRQADLQSQAINLERSRVESEGAIGLAKAQADQATAAGNVRLQTDQMGETIRSHRANEAIEWWKTQQQDALNKAQIDNYKRMGAYYGALAKNEEYVTLGELIDQRRPTDPNGAMALRLRYRNVLDVPVPRKEFGEMIIPILQKDAAISNYSSLAAGLKKFTSDASISNDLAIVNGNAKRGKNDPETHFSPNSGQVKTLEEKIRLGSQGKYKLDIYVRKPITDPKTGEVSYGEQVPLSPEEAAEYANAAGTGISRITSNHNGVMRGEGNQALPLFYYGVSVNENAINSMDNSDVARGEVGGWKQAEGEYVIGRIQGEIMRMNPDVTQADARRLASEAFDGALPTVDSIDDIDPFQYEEIIDSITDGETVSRLSAEALRKYQADKVVANRANHPYVFGVSQRPASPAYPSLPNPNPSTPSR